MITVTSWYNWLIPIQKMLCLITVQQISSVIDVTSRDAARGDVRKPGAVSC